VGLRNRKLITIVLVGLVLVVFLSAIAGSL
jgi:hypothetical protein